MLLCEHMELAPRRTVLSCLTGTIDGSFRHAMRVRMLRGGLVGMARDWWLLLELVLRAIRGLLALRLQRGRLVRVSGDDLRRRCR